jgi:ketosteroid isomerase-like protein
MASDDDVQAASDRFYRVLGDMDVSGMLEVWSQNGDVTTMHPMGGEEVGWTEVRRSFEQAADAMDDVSVAFERRTLHAAGDLAYETGIERGRGTVAGERFEFEQRVTNVYRREGGEWKLVHHHTDISPRMAEILSRRRAA